MAKEKQETNNQKGNEDTSIKPDPETLNTSDPQDHMEGPFSSLMNSTKETFEEEGGKKDDDK